MERIIEQMPIVLGALNSGFLQTLRLFFITLIGAVPLGLVIAFGVDVKIPPLEYVIQIHRLDHTRYATYDPAFNHLLFPGTGIA